MSQPENSERRLFINGLKGLAAVYAVLHHAYYEVQVTDPKNWLVRLFAWLEPGHSAVAVFIVLSGHLLMLQVNPDGRIRDGWADYFVRRARRILPPYYGAMLFSMALIALIPALSNSADVRWIRANPALWFKSSIIPHLILIHNWHPWQAYRIDPPMWSVATEWQIYFCFPALLWFFRKHGLTAAVTAAFVSSLALGAYLGPAADEGFCPWYLGLFALGMTSATFSKRSPATEVKWSDRSPRFSPAALLLCVFLSSYSRTAWGDTLVGVCTAGLLYLCTTYRDFKQSPVLRLLECPGALELGRISYSLYLVHYPLQALAESGLKSLQIGTAWRLVIHLSVGTLIILLFAHGFHLVFERPWETHGARKPVSDLEVPEERSFSDAVSSGGSSRL